MTDLPRTSSPTHRDAQRTSPDPAPEALTQLFGATRPLRRRQQLPNDALNAVPGRSALLVQLLDNRGVTGQDAIEAFLTGEWRATRAPLAQLDRAVARIVHAIRMKQEIVVFGDFDCDGITSCALLTLTLRALGAMVHAHIPQRDDDGRGLNMEAVRYLAETGTQLIITTDCGTANEAEIALAHDLDMDVIVTDHHPPHGPLAPAYAIVNPLQESDESPEKYLAGVGVAFRVAEALLAAEPTSTLSPSDLLDLVAIGTIADIALLTGANWALTRAGLQQIRLSPRPGIRALLAMARIWPADVVARDISFAIAPRINACGRMGNPRLALDLLLATDRSEADRLARDVEALNEQRQELTDKVIADARAQAESTVANGARGVVTQGDNWPIGVLGLVAGRLAEEYHRPVFVISRGKSECRGSARGPEGVDLGALLGARPELFRRFGGHAQAAGFTLLNEDLPDFLAYVKDYFTAPGSACGPIPSSEIHESLPVVADCRLALHRLRPGSSVYADLETLEPFGTGFVEPTFVCPEAQIVSCRRSGVEGRTLRLTITQGGAKHEFIWSRRGDRCDALRSRLKSLPPLDIAFSLRKYHRSAAGETEWLAHIETIAPTAS